MDSGDEDSLFLLDEEVPAADSVAEDYKSRPIDRSFSERNKRRTEWRSHERGRGDNHRDSMYGKSCPAAPIVGSLPAPSHFADDIPDLTLPPNSHQEISHMLSRSQESFDGDDLNLDGGGDEDVQEEGNSERGTQQKAARFLHFEQKRVRRKTRNVFSAMPSSCPAQMHSNFMGGRSFDPRSTKKGNDSTTNSSSSSRNLPPRAPPRQNSHQTKQQNSRMHHKHEDGEGGRQLAAHTDVAHGEPQQGSSDGPDDDPGILSTSQTALSILRNHAQFQKQKQQHQPASSDSSTR